MVGGVGKEGMRAACGSCWSFYSMLAGWQEETSDDCVKPVTAVIAMDGRRADRVTVRRRYTLR